MPQVLRTAIGNILSIDFNLGHILQGETCAVGLHGLTGLDENLQATCLAHHARDIGGARSHLDLTGSATLTDQKIEDICFLSKLLAEQPKSLERQKKAQAIYTKYIAGKISDLGIRERPGHRQQKNAENNALCHIFLTARVEEYPERVDPILKAWDSMSADSREILTENNQKSGFHGLPMIIATYRPAMMDNIFRAMPENPLQAARIGLEVLAEVIDKANQKTDGLRGTVRRVNCSDLALRIPELLSNSESTGIGIIQQIKAAIEIDSDWAARLKH